MPNPAHLESRAVVRHPLGERCRTGLGYKGDEDPLRRVTVRGGDGAQRTAMQIADKRQEIARLLRLHHRCQALKVARETGCSAARACLLEAQRPRDRARLAIDGQDLEAAREQLARATGSVLVVETTLQRRPHA